MPELHVSKKTISQLLGNMRGKKFIIPDFQRPYMWDEERCQTLWDDISDFHKNDAKNGLDYFLGTIVFYFDEDEEQAGGRDLGSNQNPKIIDGQQRITSLFLLLRAFYKRLEGMEEDRKVMGLKNQLAPCIWDTDELSLEVPDMSKIHIQSFVATEEDNDIFHDILKDGESKGMARDSYSTNYRFFEEKWDKFATESPLQWNELCVTILHKCIILPIECNTSETALTIFSTLNDRGMPLADSDIFKAKIYRKIPVERKREFTETWKEISTICDESKESGLSINDVFRYYSHVLRAQEKDKSKEIGLRKFYGNDRLNDRDTMNNVVVIAKFWQSINSDKAPDPQEGYEISTDTRKYLHCLSKYPNDFWKYATTVFFMKNKGSSTFGNDFVRFLKKMTAFLFAKFTISPTVNAIKDDIFAACISLWHENEFRVKSEFDWESVSRRMGEPYGLRFSTALLLLDAYLHPLQKELILEKCQIEHIFPKKWQNTNYNGWNEEEAKRYLEFLGNKVIIEKKVNIQAGNGYFGKKKQKYQASQIARVLDLAESSKEDWSKEDIKTREDELRGRLIDFFKEQLEVG